jgi:aryl-alcohol dehydrogenase-like predicted oxidoreductase
MTMPYRLFGRSGLRVSKFFLGAMTFGEQGGVGAPPDECRRILDAYSDAGGNVIDTAVNYRGGASEEILGELLTGRRDRFVLSTKFTASRDLTDPNAAGSHRKNLRLSLETSLRRLKTDYIDIYWVHIHDRHTPLDENPASLGRRRSRRKGALHRGVRQSGLARCSRSNLGGLARLDSILRHPNALQSAAT